MIIDTNIVIKRVKENKHIDENVTEITVLEYPPILRYEKFTGEIYELEKRDVKLAFLLQVKLRKIGLSKPVSDLLIAAICINRDEELLTNDKDFLDVMKISSLKVKITD